MTSICPVAILDPRLKAATYLTNICGMAMSETQLIFPNLLAIICWVIIHLTVMSQYLTIVICSHTSQHCLPTFSVFMVLCFRPFLLKKIVFSLIPSSPFIQICTCWSFLCRSPKYVDLFGVGHGSCKFYRSVQRLSKYCT